MENRTLTLKRYGSTPFGTLGEILLPSGKKLYTLEDPWRDNEVGKSCIPAGRYLAEWSHYNRGGYDCYELRDVAGRSEILIHVGNTHEDTSGCILVGLTPGAWDVGGELAWTIGSSRDALSLLHAEMSQEPFTLDVQWERPELDDAVAAIETQTITLKLEMPAGVKVRFGGKE